MNNTNTHPRRRSPRGLPSETHVATALDQGRSLAKAPTFHSPTSPSTEDAPLLHVPSLPDRSLTSPKALEQLVQMSDSAIDDIINNFDKSFAGLSRKVQEPSAGRSIFATPAFIDELRGSDRQAGARNRSSAVDIKYNYQTEIDDHVSDSGLGSSLASSLSEEPQELEPLGKAALTLHGSNTRRLHCLSQHATRQIRKYIVEPILKEEGLSKFHSLIKQVPLRIAERKIQTLRDLEKTLIFLAPAKATSAASYLRFCEFSIQCVHTTVDHLNVLDQRKPADRPYNNLYFVDLVEQVRQYARIMAITREKKVKGQPLDEMDHTPDETLKLIPGTATKPAELVRERNGKTIPIDTGVSSKPLTSSLDNSDMEDDSTRSMARKRKCDQGKIEWRSCRECGKRFTRPCDLTKHEKTHSRPWKCPEPDCRYHTDGWPTEKECERHVNDKHAREAKLYKCLFEPCPYTSKRESNCKQHMEKAHGWRYDRCRTKKGEQVDKLPTITVPLNAKASKTARTPSIAVSSASRSPITIDDDVFSSVPSPEDGLASSGPSTTHTSPFNAPLPLDDLDFTKMLGTGFNSNYLTPVSSNGQLSAYPQTPLSYNSPSGYGSTTELSDQFIFGANAYTNFADNFSIYQPQLLTPALSEQYDATLMPQQSISNFTLGDIPGPNDAGFEDWLNNLPPQYPPQGVSPMEDFALYDEQVPYSTEGALMFPTLGEEMMVEGNVELELENGDAGSGLKVGIEEDPVLGQWVNLDEDMDESL